MFNKKNWWFVGMLAVSPVFAGAQELTFKSLAVDVAELLGDVVGFLVVLMIVAFMWGMVRFVKARADGNDKQLDEGKKMITWSLLGIFVAVSIWGILGFLVDSVFPAGAVNDATPHPTNLLSP